MEKLIDQMERTLYEKILARDEYVLTNFTMANAWRFFMECVEKNKKVRSCRLDIEPKGDWFQVSMLMLDERGMPVYANENSYVGRVIKAKVLDDGVIEFMKGEKGQVMKIPY